MRVDPNSCLQPPTTYLNFFCYVFVRFVVYIAADCFVVTMINAACFVNEEILFHDRGGHKCHHVKDQCGFHGDKTEISQDFGPLCRHSASGKIR